MNFKKEIIEALEPYANPKISLFSEARASIYLELEKSDFEARSAKKLIKVLSGEDPINQDEFRNMIKEMIQEGEAERRRRYLPPASSGFLKLLEHIESGENPSFKACVQYYISK